MAKLVDLTGLKFNRLTVISRGPNKGSGAQWNCLCDCGNQVLIGTKKLKNGHTKSCGCLRKETAAKQGISNKLDTIEVEKRLLENGFKLISEYNGILKPSTVECLDCGLQFTRRIESSLYGFFGCPSCSKSLNGFIGTDYFEKHPEMETAPCKLYVIEFEGNNEHFWKLGITRQTIEERIRKIPYSPVSITFIENTMKEIFETEKQLKRMNKQNRYRPEITFNGHSECFNTPIQI